jgi:hypothetical protein
MGTRNKAIAMNILSLNVKLLKSTPLELKNAKNAV